MGNARLPLEDCLNELAIVRTTFETLAYFAHDREMRAELMEVMAAARQGLDAKLGGVVAAGDAASDTDFEEFRDMALRLAVDGMPGRTVDAMMRRDAFGPGQFHLRLPDGVDMAAAQALPASDLVRRLFAEVRERAAAVDSYADAHTFDAAVYRQFIALMFVTYATTDPIFYRGAR